MRGSRRRAQRPGPRGRQPAAHRGLADRAGPRRRGAGLRDRRARRRPAHHRPRGRRSACRTLAALLLGKCAQAGEQGVDLRRAGQPHDGLADPRDLVTIVGNLIDNAIDAAARSAPASGRGHGRARRPVCCTSRRRQRPGLDPRTARRAFRRGWTTKEPTTGARRGLGLALVGRARAPGGGDGRRRAQRPGGAVFDVPADRLSAVIRMLVVEDDPVAARRTPSTSGGCAVRGRGRRRAARRPPACSAPPARPRAAGRPPARH